VIRTKLRSSPRNRAPFRAARARQLEFLGDQSLRIVGFVILDREREDGAPRRPGRPDPDLLVRLRARPKIGQSSLALVRTFPVNVLNPVKAVPEVCTVHCATANRVEVLVAVTGLGRGVAGVVDGMPPVGVETDDDVAERRSLLRELGYKL